jgi:positive regulator of sigma E activity
MKTHKLTEILEESNGKLSSSRLFSFIIVFAFVFNWMQAIFLIEKFTPDISVVGLVFGVLGIRMFNRKVEK